MSNILDTLAKVDLCVHFDGALSPELLASLAADRKLAVGGDVAGVQAHVLAHDLASLQAARQWVRDLFASGDDLTAAGTDLAIRLIDQAVVHAEIYIDPTAYAATGLAPADVLTAIDAGLENALIDRDDLFLSWVFVVDLRRDLTAAAAQTLVETLVNAELPHLGGVAVSGDNEKELSAAHLSMALETARKADLGRVVAAGDRGGKDRVAEALKLGAQRLIGGTAALQDQALVLQLRAHRLPVLLLPTAQVVTGAARSMAQHPLKKMKEAGIFTTIGTGWPTLLGTSLTAEFEALSKHHQWRLDDIRNATTRAVEAAFMGPTLRFQLARTIEIWRHRPFAGPAPKGDSWSL